MIAVGVGVAPMIQTLRSLLTDISKSDPSQRVNSIERVVLLYGVVSEACFYLMLLTI